MLVYYQDTRYLLIAAFFCPKKWTFLKPRASVDYMSYWLVKSEPDTYSWNDLKKDKETYWDGVRNYQARNNMRAMREGDFVLFYHSVTEKQIVGVAKVTSEEAYQDPTTDDERWIVIDIKPVKKLKTPVTLADIKGNKALAKMKLRVQPRLSVNRVQDTEFQEILKMGETELKRD